MGFWFMHKNKLGYVLALAIITGITWTGKILIETRYQLLIVVASLAVTIIALETVRIKLRIERYRREQAPCVVTRGEQKILQASIILTISLVTLVVMLL